MVKYYIYLSKEGGTSKASITYSYKSTNSIMSRTAFSDRIPHLLWYTKVHYHIHYRPSLAPVPNLMNSVHNIIYYFCMTHINPYPTAFLYGNRMVLHFYQQQESSTNKTVHKVINKGLKAYV